MEGAQLRAQDDIALRPGGEPASQPRVEPTAGHPHTPAEDRDTMLGPLRRDEGKPHRLCFAKNAVALFRMSRSSSAIRSALHPAHGAGFELVGELAARSPLRCVGHRSGHRIPLWKDVHQTGSSPKAALIS
jgi:hypothetical protein